MGNKRLVDAAPAKLLDSLSTREIHAPSVRGVAIAGVRDRRVTEVGDKKSSAPTGYAQIRHPLAHVALDLGGPVMRELQTDARHFGRRDLNDSQLGVTRPTIVQRK